MTIVRSCAYSTFLMGTTIDSKALALAMDRAGYNPTRLAGSVGISVSYMHDIATGRRNLARNPKLRNDLARALDVPVRWIEVGA